MTRWRLVLVANFIITVTKCCYGQVGSLDPTFNPGTGANGTVFAVALGTSGGVFVAGTFTTVNNLPRNNVARLLADGTLDPEFDPGQGPNGYPRALVPLADGKAVIAGNFSAINDIPFGHVARLRADGSVDLSFQDPKINASVSRLTALPNSQLLVVGPFTAVGSTPRRNVARLNANGSLDLTFNASVGVTNASVFSALMQPDGKVMLAGDFQVIGGTARKFVARVATNGTLDSTFDAGFVGGSDVSRLLLQPDGKVLLAGNFTSIDGYSRIGIARLHTNGAVDTSFSLPNGISSVTSLTFQPDGKILLGSDSGYAAPPPLPFSQNYLLRLNANGTADSLFRPLLNLYVFGTAIQSDGRIVIGGDFQQVNRTNINRVARLKNDASASGIVTQLGLTLHAGITVVGTAGERYRIESTTNLNLAALWTPLTNLTLTGSSGRTYDPVPVSRRQTFYRAVLMP